MNHQDQLQLESERRFLTQQLDSLPENAVLTRSSTASRIKVVEQQLNRLPCQPRPLKAQLTFRGRPVIGSHGIFAEFGSRATHSFTEAVAKVGAALQGCLAPSGPIPNRDRHQLLITSTAIGSFGFELEEHRPDTLPFDEETPVSRAIEVTLGLLESSARGTDDELAESASGINGRSIDAVRDFVELLASNEAVCALSVGNEGFRFRDVGEVRRSLDRLSHDNLHEIETSLLGEFLGALPQGRTFEFKVAADDEVVRGRISPDIDDPTVINQHLNQPIEVTVLATRVGEGKARYQLLKLPDWTTTK